MLLDLLAGLPALAQWLLAVGGAVLLLAGPVRWVVQKTRRGSSKVGAAFDALLGRPEIRHPDTGQVLAEATPGLGARLAHMEQAIIDLADTRREIVRLTERFDQHLLEAASRSVSQQTLAEEQKAMWQAIEAIAKAPSSDS